MAVCFASAPARAEGREEEDLTHLSVSMMNFEEPNANLVSHEFLAVILAGFGDE
jgi:hypothetical protein